ncbi:hypothetical protein [Dyadobacter aurulentus]|uniref:hypothetical protein n=1 Tax=Dyadobacter sp. UC 10 TaxID=2605428 RepID=UPI0011F0FD7F|nr:hypothetical protein [Dyadobacter sp. UC 10]KAA0992080.1 hypothetical protein FXO21_18815 [Dyadobacter sp. UC 10]
MKKLIILITSALLLFTAFSCKKDIIEPDTDIENPVDTTGQDGGHTPPDSLDSQEPQPQPPSDKRITIRPVIKVGQIVYDSIPVQLIVRSWDTKNEMDYKIYYLPGPDDIYIPAKGARFHFTINKWGGQAERTFTQAELQDNASYTIGLQIEPKKIKSIVEVKIVEGKNTPLSKTDYEYAANGDITKRTIWGKRADFSNYIMQTDLFAYTNGDITSIKSYDEGNKPVKTLTARYDNQHRVVALEEVKGLEKISAKAGYFLLDTYSGNQQAYRIDVQYHLENGKYTDYYSRKMAAGRTIYDIYASHNGGNEEGYYDYDNSLNPYAHLRLPELNFSQHDMHNRTFPRKHYGHGRPEYEPYDYKYTYNPDGYPKELLTKYRHTGSKMDAYTMRTVFTY